MRTIIAGLALALVSITPAQPQQDTRPCEVDVPRADPADLSPDQVARRDKCQYLWARVAPWSYSPEIVEHLIAEHERLGIGPEWPYSFCYGFSNFGLTIGKRVGPCYGPMDVRREWARACGFAPNDLRDPLINITCHVREMALYHDKTGETGMALLARVFYPARPMYYRRWRPTWRRMITLLSAGYASGAIGERTVAE